MKTPSNHRKHLRPYLPAEQEALQEILIPYAPRRDLRNWWHMLCQDNPLWSIALVLSVVTLFCTALIALPLALLFLMLGFGGGYTPQALWAFVALFAAGIGCLSGGFALIGMYWAQQPTFIAAGAKGLRFLYLHQGESQASVAIPFESIVYAGLKRTSGWAPAPLEVEFTVDRGGLPPGDLEALFFLHNSFKDGRQFSTIKCPLNCLSSPHAAEIMHTALRSFLPPDRYDPELQNVLNPLTPESYTSMWLESFHSAKSQLREGVLSPGARVGNGQWEIQKELGCGGQGRVYLARCCRGDASPQAAVVLKEFLLPGQTDAAAGSRALRGITAEAQLLKTFTHPQIVAFVDMFVDDHRAYLVLENIEGRSLRDYIAEHGAACQEDIIKLAHQLCSILIFLHGLNPPVIHQDFTPENLLIGGDGMITLIDFSACWQLSSMVELTAAGKQAYMAPEQLRGRPTRQSDIYALGATLFFLCTGRDPEPLSQSHVEAVAADVSEPLAQIIARCTDLDQEHRYALVEQVRLDLLALPAPTGSWSKDNCTARPSPEM